MDQKKEFLKNLFEHSTKPEGFKMPKIAKEQEPQALTEKHKTSPTLDHPRGSIQLYHMHTRIREILEFLDKNYKVLTDAINFLTDVGTIGLRVQSFEIGAWDMVSTATASIAHTIPVANILGLSANILEDSGNTGHSLFTGGLYPTASVANDLWVSHSTATVIGLIRRSGGVFDSTTFNDTGMNRGNLIVFYKE